MSPEKQRIAIAEACGLHTFGYTPSITGRDALVHVGEGMAPRLVPDYLNDLNAMHEAEKTLTTKQRDHYLLCGYSMVIGEQPPVEEPPSIGYWEVPAEAAYEQVTMPAAQRAEAFLRTIGKWEDDK